MVMASMVAQARHQLESLAFVTSVDVLSPVKTTDARGAVKEDWTTPVVVSTLGRVMQPGAADRRVLDDENISGTAYVIGLPVGTVVAVGNRLRVNAKSYSILAVNVDGTQILYVRCLCYLPGN